MTMSAGTARIAIDRGGTFTDVICSRPDHEDIVFKVRLSIEMTAVLARVDISFCRSTRRTTQTRREKGESMAVFQRGPC
jgi:N-methylhydantoinase A/oxoprolinase/acetone carboxylase beta subunit